MTDEPARARTLKDIIGEYRAIEREHKMGREEWEKFRQNPLFDAFAQEMDAGAERRGIQSTEEREENKIRTQWGKLCDAAWARKVEAFAMFAPQEQEMLEKHAQKLIGEAHALCLTLQEKCPRLGGGGFDDDEVIYLWRFYRAQHDAIRRLSRRCDWWEEVHGLISGAQKQLEQAPSDFVN